MRGRLQRWLARAHMKWSERFQEEHGRSPTAEEREAHKRQKCEGASAKAPEDTDDMKTGHRELLEYGTPLWEWQVNENSWRSYDESDAAQLEAEYARSFKAGFDTRLELEIAGAKYRVSLETNGLWTQQRFSSSETWVSPVRRRIAFDADTLQSMPSCTLPM